MVKQIVSLLLAKSKEIIMAKNEKICIIGAGPAGLSAAVHLEKNGYTDYAILEREDHVGGKCHSPYHDGKRFEMGAIMGCPTYYAVHELELFGGVDHIWPNATFCVSI